MPGPDRGKGWDREYRVANGRRPESAHVLAGQVISSSKGELRCTGWLSDLDHSLQLAADILAPVQACAKPHACRVWRDA